MATGEEVLAKGAVTAAKGLSKAGLFAGGLVKRAASFGAGMCRAYKRRSQAAKAQREQAREASRVAFASMSHEELVQYRKRSGYLTCQHCGGAMERATLSSGNCLGILLALIVFFSGLFVFVFFFWTCIGAAIGGLMMLLGLGMGGTRRKVWKCGQCGYVFDRA
jgi:rubrerythrin